jgi:2-dehydropantoate 2-reductase
MVNGLHMDIIVLGAGAIGSVYGAKLSAQHAVTLVGRAPHVEAIRQHGLILEGLEPGTHRLAAATRVEAVPPEALILLTSKVNDTETVVAPIVPLLTPGVTILCVQNGLYSEALVRGLVGGRATVLRAITQFGAVLVKPGVVEYTVAGYTLIEAHARAAATAAVLTGCGLEGRVTPHMKREMWRKAIFNCAINPVTALTGCDVAGITDPRLLAVKQAVVGECLSVARLDGVVFEEDFLRLIDEVFASSHSVSSMRQDLLKGRRTEIDYMNGAVAALGARHGVDCPANRVLTALIKSMEPRA